MLCQKSQQFKVVKVDVFDSYTGIVLMQFFIEIVLTWLYGGTNTTQLPYPNSQ
jgi:hypothetical protein